MEGAPFTESRVASTSVIRLSIRTIFPFNTASLSRIVLSVVRDGTNGRVGKKLVCGRLTEIVQELHQLRHAQLDGLSELALLPVALHTLCGNGPGARIGWRGVGRCPGRARHNPAVYSTVEQAARSPARQHSHLSFTIFRVLYSALECMCSNRER
eukprot:scaffold224390_cov43-Tisochrysis_lutea.AAC.1